MTTRDINNDEAIQMLNRCKHEITQMRTELDHLRPKAEAYDNLKIALSFARTSQGYGQVSEDLVWIIQKRIDELAPKANPIQTSNMPFDLNKTHAPAKSSRIPIGDLSPDEINEIERREKFDPDPYTPKDVTEANS